MQTSTKEELISLLKNKIKEIEKNTEDQNPILHIRKSVLDFLDSYHFIDEILENKIDDLKNLVVLVFGEESKQKLTVERIAFIYEGSKICDDLPQLNTAKKELLNLLDELKRKVKDYDTEVQRITKNNQKLEENATIYKNIIYDLEYNHYIKNSKIVTDVILNSELKESEIYQLILYLAKFNTKRLEGKEDFDDTYIETKQEPEQDYLFEYFETIKNVDFSLLEEHQLFFGKNLPNFQKIKDQLLALLEEEITNLKKLLADKEDLFLQRNLEVCKRNLIFLKQYTNELKINQIIQNNLIYKLPQIRNTIIMEDFRKENFEKKDYKDIYDLILEFKENQVEKDVFFDNKLINTYKITKNNVNLIIIHVKENVYVAIKLFRFGSTSVEKDVLERLNVYKDELEMLIDELNNPVGYKEILDLNHEIEKPILDTLQLNAKVGD